MTFLEKLSYWFSLNIRNAKSKTAYVIGNFQFHELSEYQNVFLTKLLVNYNKVVIIIRQTPVPFTKTNPLNFAMREELLYEFDSSLVFYTVHDTKNTIRFAHDVQDIIFEGHSYRSSEEFDVYASKLFMNDYHGVLSVPVTKNYLGILILVKSLLKLFLNI